MKPNPAITAVAVAVTLGTVVGLAAGYAGGWLDAVLMRFVDAALAVPRLDSGPRFPHGRAKVAAGCAPPFPR